MLFFTQCFGAVLDLIHLRFQHYKAKRVFSAAGQLVCVVNPTHNLKVSGSLSLDVPAAWVQVHPPGASVTLPRARGTRGKGWSTGARTVLGTRGRGLGAHSPSLGGWMLSATVCCFPDWQEQLE